MSELNNTAFNEQLTHLISLPSGRERDRATREVFELLVRSGTIGRWAGSIAAKNNFQDRSGLEDIEQVIGEKLFRTLATKTPENSRNIADWLRFLHGNARNGVKDYLSSGQVTAAAGMSGRERRTAIIARTRAELTGELEREPSMSEVITRANTWALAHHKDARRQGLLLTEDDFAPVSLTPVSLDETPSVAPGITNDMDTYSEATLALRRLRETADRMYPDDGDLRRVVVVWVECVAEGERPSQPVISARAQLRRERVRNAMVRLNSVLEEMREVFGSDY